VSEERRKGIVDPWRHVDGLRPKPRAPTPERKDLSDIDLDADLAIPGQHVMRAAHSSIRIIHVRIETPRDALDVLAECLAEIRKTKGLGTAMTTLGICVRCRTGSWNIPSDDTPASTLKSHNATIWFVHKTLDQGMLDLARLLREPLAAPIAAKWGVTPMFNA
jgi:hypothetical protein